MWPEKTPQNSLRCVSVRRVYRQLILRWDNRTSGEEICSDIVDDNDDRGNLFKYNCWKYNYFFNRSVFFQCRLQGILQCFLIELNLSYELNIKGIHANGTVHGMGLWADFHSHNSNLHNLLEGALYNNCDSTNCLVVSCIHLYKIISKILSREA